MDSFWRSMDRGSWQTGTSWQQIPCLCDSALAVD